MHVQILVAVVHLTKFVLSLIGGGISRNETIE